MGNKKNLVNLLKKFIKIKGLGRIRLSSIEITEVSDELIKLISQTNKICRHLHLPLQSGSNKILKPMNRPYTVKYYENKIRKIRKVMPDIALTTDVMVGFPGETNKDFKQTYDENTFFHVDLHCIQFKNLLKLYSTQRTFDLKTSMYAIINLGSSSIRGANSITSKTLSIVIFV